jgi:DNA-binding GntR family transcriptional regulator
MTYNAEDGSGLPRSLGDKVFEKLKDDILYGRYQPGENLVELRISEEMGVSRTPIREAIHQLELEGLVSVVPNKGAVVSGISDKDIEDIYEIRRSIECLAARWAAMHATDGELDDIGEILDLEEFYTARQDFPHILQLDSRFHQQLFQACKSKPLIHVLLHFHEYVKKARNTSLMSPGRAARALEEHKAIFHAIRSRDACLAEKLMTLHIENAKESLAQEIKRA